MQTLNLSPVFFLDCLNLSSISFCFPRSILLGLNEWAQILKNYVESMIREECLHCLSRILMAKLLKEGQLLLFLFCQGHLFNCEIGLFGKFFKSFLTYKLFKAPNFIFIKTWPLEVIHDFSEDRSRIRSRPSIKETCDEKFFTLW